MSSPPVSSSATTTAVVNVVTTTSSATTPSTTTSSTPSINLTSTTTPTSPSTIAVVGEHIRPGANTVFVGGVSWKADEESLREFFATKHGAVVDCKIITDRGTGKSKGYGFVTFSDVETAEAVKKSTDLFFLGKMMNVGDAYRKTEPTTIKRSPPTLNSTPLSTEPTSPPPFIPAATNPAAMYQYYGYQPYPYYNMGHEQFQYGPPYPVYPGYHPVMYEQPPVYPFPWPVPGEPIAPPPPMTYGMPPVDDLALAVGQMSLEPCAPTIFRPTPVLATR